MVARTTGATLVTAFAMLLARGWLGTLVCGAGVLTFCLCFCMLAWGRSRGLRRAAAWAGLLAGLGCGAVGLATPDPQASPVQAPPPHHRPLVEPLTDAAVPLGLHARALTRSGAKLLAVTDTGLVEFDPLQPGVSPKPLPIHGAIAALAADASYIVVAEGGSRSGFVSIFDAQTYRSVRTPLHYSEASGAVALGGGAAWLCNVTHAKLDRLDLQTGAFDEIPVPAAPNDVLVAHGSVWVTIASGWLVRIDLDGGRVRRYPTTADPERMTFAFGTIWISHPQDRVLTRVDPDTGEPVGRPIPVRADTQQLAALHGSLFAVSGATDALQRVDPVRGRVVSVTKLPTDPSGLVARGGRLYVTSEHAGTLVPVTVRPRP